MPTIPLEISLKFNSIEEAIETLLKLRTMPVQPSTQKVTLAKSVYPTQEEGGKPHFKNMSVRTLENILSALNEKYPHTLFRRSDVLNLGLKHQGHPASQSLVGYVFQYGVSIGKLRLALGLYSFNAPATAAKRVGYTPDKESLMDIVASQQHTAKLVSIFRMVGRVCKSVTFYINEQGISARFS